MSTGSETIKLGMRLWKCVNQSAFEGLKSEVIVHKLSRVWNFVCLPILPIAIFRAQKTAWLRIFKDRQSGGVEIQVNQLLVRLLQAYYQEAFEDGPCAESGLRACINTCRFVHRESWLLVALHLWIRSITPGKIICQILLVNWPGFGFPHFQCQVEADDQLTKNSNRPSKLRRIKLPSSQRRNCGLWSLVSNGSSTSRGKTSLWFQSQKAATNLSWTGRDPPMIDITTEEPHCFQGSLWCRAKVTRTGRVLINFKMTDYTSSFRSKKWAKNEEAQEVWYDQGKTLGCRFVGISRSITLRDLTMSVQRCSNYGYVKSDARRRASSRVPYLYQYVDHGCLPEVGSW